jgi:hypothetical protein
VQATELALAGALEQSMRANKMIYILCLLPFGLWHGPASAEYLVDGQIEGSVCTNYIVFQKCRFVNVDAVQGED